MHWIAPESLPETTGTVERFIVNPKGEVDGFVMKDQADKLILVHTPPHLDEELSRHLKAGDKVSVHGVRPRKASLIAAVAITTDNGRKIVDNGPDPEREPRKTERRKMQAQGTVRLSLFGPKGELRGALLTDGTVIRLGPKESQEIAELFAPGAAIAVSGDGVETRHGRVIEADEIGAHPDELQPVRKHKPKPKPDHKDHAAHA